MSDVRFFMTDVFATKRYTGNQLATFVDAGSLSSREMQRIAIEMHFSESTFVLSSEPRDGGYDVRIFTPAEEVDFAGHPTLGTAFVIRRFLEGAKVNRITLNLRLGQIPVDFSEFPEGDIWMQQHPPTFDDELDPSTVAKVLSLPGDALDSSLPVQDVSTGLPFCIVPLVSMDHLKAIRVNWEQYHTILDKTDAKGLLAFAPGGYEDEQDFGVRVFVPLLGIPEDAATGSGNGCLAGYLYKYCGNTAVDVTVGQGYEIGRPSRIKLRAEQDGEQISVRVGGRVMAVGEGTLY